MGILIRFTRLEGVSNLHCFPGPHERIGRALSGEDQLLESGYIHTVGLEHFDIALVRGLVRSLPYKLYPVRCLEDIIETKPTLHRPVR